MRYRRSGHDIGLGWRKHMVVLYVVSILFVVRNIARIVEFNQSGDGYITTHESMLYVFDGSFMLFVSVLLIFVHPGTLFREARRRKKLDGLGGSNELAPFAHD
jgi:hypothetical protein